MSGYIEALAAHNAMHDPKAADKKVAPDMSGLKRFMEAQGVSFGG